MGAQSANVAAAGGAAAGRLSEREGKGKEGGRKAEGVGRSAVLSEREGKGKEGGRSRSERGVKNEKKTQEPLRMLQTLFQ